MKSVEEYVADLADASGELVANISGLTDEDVREPSLLPDWTRGHVLTHLARNADGEVRLLGWARTGVPSYEYPSVADRAAEIEAGAGRPAAILVADVRDTVNALAAAAAQMQPDDWQHLVTWTTGQQTPASMVVRSRLAEVLIHHVDLALGYRPGAWPASFVHEMLDLSIAAINDRSPAPLTARLEATDTGREFQIGKTAAARVIRGTEAAMLAWIMGRSDGAGLARDDAEPLPKVPSIYLT